LEDATRMVSILDLFSRNENVRDLPTESLKFFLLPVLLGSLNGKLIDETERRLEQITVIETYYIDFLTRVRDYGLEANLNIPNVQLYEEEDVPNSATSMIPKQNQPDLAKMNNEREEKIKRYREKKELETQLKQLKILAVDVEKEHRDEEDVRKYYLKLIHSFVLFTLDEILSYEMEKPILHHMAKVRKGEVPNDLGVSKAKRSFKPIIITKDAMQKEVFGMGYKSSVPIITIEEFYEQRVRDGLFPSAEETKQKQSSLLNRATTDAEEANIKENEEARIKEMKEENDDEEELESKRRMDEYKDDHKRGEGNRHNRA